MRLLLLPILLISLLTSCKEDEPKPTIKENPFLIEPGAKPLVIAHRGGKALMPENTMLAFNNAVSLGVEVLEMDVVLTKDTVLVTIHDLTIDDTADTTGKVSDYTLAELQQFNFGYAFKDAQGNYPYRTNPVQIPTIKEVLMTHPDQLLNIEIKDQDERGKLAAEKLIAAINTYHTPKKVIAFSFQDVVMKYFRSMNTEGIYTGASLEEGFELYNAVLAGTADSLVIAAEVFSIPDQIATFNFTADSLIAALHQKNVAVHYWTINNKDDMRTLVQRGADAIITDHPDRLQEVLGELGF